MDRIYTRTDFTTPFAYENNLNESTGRILSATIESEKVEGKLMRVFVPIFSNEASVYDGICGEYIDNEDLDREGNRQLKWAYYLDCFHEYHQFYVNDSLYHVELMKYNHPNMEEYGVLTYLPTNNFNIGKNTLRIEKLKDKDGAVYRSMIIGFWFAE